MPTIREVKTELRHREWAEQIQGNRQPHPNVDSALKKR